MFFDRPCLENLIKFSEEAVINCPFADNEYKCNSCLLDEEIRAVSIIDLLVMFLFL